MTITVVITKLRLAVAVFAIAVLAPTTAFALDSWSGTAFCPDRSVTRGENITFAHRYDTLIVQPALTTLNTAQPFAVTGFETGNVALADTPAQYVKVTVDAPVAGHVTVNSTAGVFHNVSGGGVLCVIVESSDIPANVSVGAESVQRHVASGLSLSSSLSGTRTFSIAAGATIDYVLACEESTNGGVITARNLTAIFTPAP